MKLTKTVFAAAALALATSGAFAAGDSSRAPIAKDPGFNKLDRNNDGLLTRSEAARDPDLAKKFSVADKNHDGKLSRGEYLAVKGREDLNSASNKMHEFASRAKEKIAASRNKNAGASAGATSKEK